MICERCEKMPAEPGDCFCVPCRVEVLAMSQTVHDPVEHVLSRHQHLCGLVSDERVMCMCCEMFDGPAYHRRHVAEKVYEALGLDEPMPWTPSALDTGDEGQ
jgi:hypothetical protein